MTIDVLRTGPKSLLVAAPSGALTSYGVPPSGPFDRGAYALGQALLGGRPDAGLEVVLGGLCFRTRSQVRVAVTGAEVPILVDGLPVSGPVVALRPGAELALGLPRTGLRTYVAVEGGLVSARPGLLGGYGPQPVNAGDELLVLDATESVDAPDPLVGRDALVGQDALVASGEPGAYGSGLRLGARISPILTVLAGPRLSHLADPAQLEGEWTVSPQSDRVGVRVDGPKLDRTGSAEVAPEGIVRGAIQAPPAGPLVIFGPDHPTTGGYPVVGVLTPASADALAQRRPGERIQLRWG